MDAPAIGAAVADARAARPPIMGRSGSAGRTSADRTFADRTSAGRTFPARLARFHEEPTPILPGAVASDEARALEGVEGPCEGARFHGELLREGRKGLAAGAEGEEGVALGLADAAAAGLDSALEAALQGPLDAPEVAPQGAESLLGRRGIGDNLHVTSIARDGGLPQAPGPA